MFGPKQALVTTFEARKITRYQHRAGLTTCAPLMLEKGTTIARAQKNS